MPDFKPTVINRTVTKDTSPTLLQSLLGVGAVGAGLAGAVKTATGTDEDIALGNKLNLASLALSQGSNLVGGKPIDSTQLIELSSKINDEKRAKQVVERQQKIDQTILNNIPGVVNPNLSKGSPEVQKARLNQIAEGKKKEQALAVQKKKAQDAIDLEITKQSNRLVIEKLKLDKPDKVKAEFRDFILTSPNYVGRSFDDLTNQEKVEAGKAFNKKTIEDEKRKARLNQQKITITNNLPKPPNTAILNSFTQAIDMKTELDQLGVLANADFTGPIDARLGALRIAFGIGKDVTDEAVFRQSLEDLTDLFARLRTGAVINASEEETFKRIVADVKDPDSIFQAKISNFLKKVNNRLINNLKISRDLNFKEIDLSNIFPNEPAFNAPTFSLSELEAEKARRLKEK